jgi:hypothetical protein
MPKNKTADVARTDKAARPGRARVKVQPLNVHRARFHPPIGQPDWWERLERALGTSSSDFVGAALDQLAAAARLPFGGISETAVNAALAIIEGAEPRNEVEAALAIQMACTHTAAMAVLARIGGGHGPDRSVAMMAAAASRLVRANAAQLEVYRRLKNGGSQFVRVEHVHVNSGGQAVIGNVRSEHGNRGASRGTQATTGVEAAVRLTGEQEDLPATQADDARRVHVTGAVERAVSHRA